MKVKNAKEGVRFDNGKAPMHLVPWEMVLFLAKIYQMGAAKYAPRNWEKGMAWSRVFNSLMRHSIAFWIGEDNDPESKLHHMLHVIWNATTLFMYSIWYPKLDDRSEMSKCYLNDCLTRLESTYEGESKKRAPKKPGKAPLQQRLDLLHALRKQRKRMPDVLEQNDYAETELRQIGAKPRRTNGSSNSNLKRSGKKQKAPST